ncbi:MAG: polysaccharide deacetylase, partial [Legionellaceae bacterium]|nr:polysaccharide deacetylase [Legionellaceae bacterium]
INTMSSSAYIQEIQLADKILSPILTEPKYFRYPYLSMGIPEKKAQIHRYLSAENYLIAPVTTDSKDFMFNQLLLSVPEKKRRSFLNFLKPCYLEFIWEQTLSVQEKNLRTHKPEQAQILLIHANLLNAYVLPDIINLYKQHGFTFVSLSDALKTNGVRVDVSLKFNRL